jgi:hypothetical protein
MALARDPLADTQVFGDVPADGGDRRPNSWPVTIGTGTVFCAQSSQL